MRTILALLALFLNLVGSTTEVKPPKPPAADLLPIVLNSTSFDGKIGDGSLWFVEFYAPWCTHCTNMAPTYNQLAKHFHEKNFENANVKGFRNIKIAKVNGDAEKALTNRFGIYGFPSFYLIDGWSVYEYDGSRSVKAMTEFINGGYLDSKPLPFYSSPFGPLGLLQGAIIRAGLSVARIFYSLQTDYGLSELFAGAIMFGSFFVGTFVMIVVLALNVKTKID